MRPIQAPLLLGIVAVGGPIEHVRESDRGTLTDALNGSSRTHPTKPSCAARHPLTTMPDHLSTVPSVHDRGEVLDAVRCQVQVEAHLSECGTQCVGKLHRCCGQLPVCHHVWWRWNGP